MRSEPAIPPSFLIYNGTVVDATAAHIAVGDGTVACGQGAFETLAAYEGTPFLAPDHFERLRRAADALDLFCPPDRVLLEAMDAALRANDLATAPKARIRISLTSPPRESGEGKSGVPESWFVEATPPPPHPATAKVVTVPFIRNERGALRGLKTPNYGENVVALRFAREAGADEALFGNTREQLCEAAWANVFLCHEGRIVTPPLGSGCLPGVTRSLVIELLRELGEPVLEVDFPMAELPEVTSAFLTSSLREIQPVSKLDGRELIVPSLLGELLQAFRKRVAELCGTRAT